jgi:hypothetical protein
MSEIASLPGLDDEPPGDANVVSSVSSVESDAVESAAEPPDADPPATGDDPGPDEELEEIAFVEPPEPVVSANAIAGIDAIAAPTPKATARAPTRPT